jgi:hypothetical protein
VEEFLGSHVVVQAREQANMTGADRPIEGQERGVEGGELAGFQGRSPHLGDDWRHVNSDESPRPRDE